MNIHFTKYHGAGNDFVVIDDRDRSFPIENTKLVQYLCHRRFGIGSDGLLLLRNHERCDFEMIYINSQGYCGNMCGNGGRCITAFAYHLGVVDELQPCSFMGPDGIHYGKINPDGEVGIQMTDVSNVRVSEERIFLNSGTTKHCLQIVSDLAGFPVFETGRRLQKEIGGMNVDFIELIDDEIHARVYEDGVENETLACGTGATSIAIGLVDQGYIGIASQYPIHMPGGTLTISFEYEKDRTRYHNIWLKGPAVAVFRGEIEVDVSQEEYFLPRLSVRSPIEIDNLHQDVIT